MQNGTLVTYSSHGSTYYGFIVGPCDYDGMGSVNAYAIRYVMKQDESPRRPYTIVAADQLRLVTEFPEDFFMAGHWSATPNDRTEIWDLKREQDRILVVGRPK